MVGDKDKGREGRWGRGSFRGKSFRAQLVENLRRKSANEWKKKQGTI